jgi:hypothetical protein
MSIGLISDLSGLAGRLVVAHRRRKTRRIIEQLPDDILKDIGYARDWRGQVSVSRDSYR